jgi:hypothetical protein
VAQAREPLGLSVEEPSVGLAAVAQQCFDPLGAY